MVDYPLPASPSLSSHRFTTNSGTNDPTLSPLAEVHPSSLSPRRDRDHSWKSVFRLGNSSSRKLSSTPVSSSLTLDLPVLPSASSSSQSFNDGTPQTSNGVYSYGFHTTLTPAGSRSSFNSMSSAARTQSSDSSGGGVSSPRSLAKSPSHTALSALSATGTSSYSNDTLGVSSPVSTKTPKLLGRTSKRSLIGLGRAPSSTVITNTPNENGTSVQHQDPQLLHPRSASHNNSHSNSSNTHPKRAQTANPSQPSFTLPQSATSPSIAGPSHSHSGSRLTPKSMTRFIRRVASAPNAKGLFSLGSSSSSGKTSKSSAAAARKNGLLAAPDEDLVPPLPVVFNHGNHGNPGSSMEAGTDSLETISSGGSSGAAPSPPRTNSNSRARNSALPSPSSIAQSFTFSRNSSGAVKDKDRDKTIGKANGNGTTTRVVSSNGYGEGPGKVAFRRTYSSNSIKVREVGVVISIHARGFRFYLSRWTLITLTTRSK